jgi:DNA-binding GntR family transcriptional regulator
VRVCEPSNEEILNAYGLRLLLEGAAARGAALRITDEGLAALHELLTKGESLVRLEDMPHARVLSRELHSSIVGACGNPLLHKAYLAALNTFPDWRLYEQLFRHPELLGDSMEAEHREHLHIVEALRIHDPAAAVERTLEHVVNRGRELEAYLGIPAEAIHAKETEILPLFSMGAMPESS